VWGANGNLTALISHIAHRPEFLADATIGNRVKSPVELLVSVIKTLGVQDLSDWSFDWVSYVLRQNPIDPPDVSGWDNAWLHPSHLVIWSRFSYWMAWSDRGPEADGTADATPVGKQNPTLRKFFAEGTSATAMEMALALAGLHDVSSQTRSAIDTFARACGVMQMVFNSPEFLVS